MSVDKFGRSRASIARNRRPLALPPSRRQLLSVGALCRTGDYVDFKEALARNIGNPLLPSDAACKEYVDQTLKQVQLALQKSVADSIPTMVKETHALTVEFLNKHLATVNGELAELKKYIAQVEFNVNRGEQKAVRDINDMQQDVVEINDEVTKMRDRVIVLEHEVDQHIEKSEETANVIRNRIIELESSTLLLSSSPELADLKPTKPVTFIRETATPEEEEEEEEDK